MSNSRMQTKSFRSALESIELYKELLSRKEFILSKQYLRSSTSVGANIREAKNAQSKRDFIHKLSISLKECDESLYWLQLLKESNFIDAEQFANLVGQADELLRMLRGSVMTAKSKL